MATWFSSCAIFLVLLLLSHQGSPSHASNTLTANQQLSGNKKLISQDGNFALGFFQPAEGSDGKWYIGIWYNEISVQTIVWVANREKPVSDPVSSNLIISDDGNLVLLANHSKSPTWSTNIKNNTAASSTVAVLLNTGNLVVRHNSNTSIVLWQSFDDFTDTWLPGNKLSRNKKTGVIKRMISWKDRGDPAPGLFSIQLDPNGSPQYVLQWNSSIVYWATGNWSGNAYTGVPELSPTNKYPNSGYTFQFVDNDVETYFTYTVKNDAQTFTRAIVDVSGLFQAFVWTEAAQAWITFFTQPKAKCNVYGVCGENSKCSENAASSCSCLKGFIENYPNNWKLDDRTAGCRRNVPLKCGNNGSVKTKQDRFYVINSVKLPDNAHGIDAANVRACELTCLNNCSCTAYSHNGTCLVWYNHLINLQDNIVGSSDSIFIRLAASELPNSGTKKRWIIVIIIGGFVVLSFGVTILYFCHRRRRISGINHVDGSLISFKYRDLQFLTRNFSERLGAGSFGSVFKGVLPDTTTVAVKKLEGIHQGEKQFRAEVSTIGNIHHMNLIRLVGFCSEGKKRLLVYEYMPNGSLDKHLFGSSSITFSWKIRHQIAVGIARGLAYLHEECRDCIIHCDVKPQNILLDASFVPKVADLGLAKLLGRDFSRVLTSMRGTVGYLAPEWISGEAITTKADVFSYGMMLFEIISGKRNLEHAETSMETFFPVLVARKLLGGEVHTLLSTELINSESVEELERACKVACWCVQDNESSRPTMGEIVKILEGLVDVEMPPIPRYLQVLAEGSRFRECSFSFMSPL
ncbi:G-type lectin S-receptor-like serine/threonine-protein kinase At2g19130 [Phragmites australis]|uniref:G-type lectin S-receptor-like serine/threonine-protein kinase At2g19130 n=1 Tax=Phragmites australis TaxID=29695 RepID=UPI002D769F62|nr:G-type lectin S-receptor-like serine/threonine-protein kinase At2g19130 [Phragmites australis]